MTVGLHTPATGDLADVVAALRRRPWPERLDRTRPD